MDLLHKIKNLSKEYTADITANRHHLHKNPELSFHEHKTARFVADQLKALGLQPQEGVAGTGVVALIEAKNPVSYTHLTLPTKRRV